MADKKKTTKQAEREMMPLGRRNFVMMACCLLLIVVGFALMAGSPNVGDTFNNAIFEPRRVTIGPMLALLGFVLMAPAILIGRRRQADDKSLKNDDITKAQK